MPKPKKSTKNAEPESLTETIFTNTATTLRNAEEGVEAVETEIFNFFSDRPKTGAVLSGGVGLAGAMLFGVAEVGAAVVAGYLGYRMFAYQESFSEAIEKGIKLEKGELPPEEM